MEGFKFNLGDVLVHRACLASPVEDCPVRLFVLGLTTVTEEPGVVHPGYMVRAVSEYRAPSATTGSLLEVEVASLAEYEAAREAEMRGRSLGQRHVSAEAPDSGDDVTPGADWPQIDVESAAWKIADDIHTINRQPESQMFLYVLNIIKEYCRKQG